MVAAASQRLRLRAVLRSLARLCGCACYCSTLTRFSRLARWSCVSLLNCVTAGLTPLESLQKVDTQEQQGIQPAVEVLAMPGVDPTTMDVRSLYKAIAVINHLAVELDVESALESVKQCTRELLECEKVTVFLVNESRQEIRQALNVQQLRSAYQLLSLQPRIRTITLHCSLLIQCQCAG